MNLWESSGGDGSEFVQHAVSVYFSGFQSIAEIQEPILRRTTVHLVDGPTHVSDQAFELETVHRHDFDVMACRAGLQGTFKLFERVPADALPIDGDIRYQSTTVELFLPDDSSDLVIRFTADPEGRVLARRWSLQDEAGDLGAKIRDDTRQCRSCLDNASV